MISDKDVLLLNAARSGNFNQILAILTQGANVDATDRDGTTALMFAAQQGYTEIVRVLIEAGANLNLPRKRYGLTALMLAASEARADVLQTLVAAGADVNAKNDDGSTALMIAAHKGHLMVVQILLGAGADVNLQDKDEDSALKLAAQEGHSSVVKALLELVQTPRLVWKP
jgi:ankyrin repeat protein